MKHSIIILALLFTISCKNENEQKNDVVSPAIGTWQLIESQTIQDKDTTINYYTDNKKAIKIITETHFAFFQHDLNKGQDSTKIFVSGSGKCSIDGTKYTENLEYCNYREWEGYTFDFELKVNGDTLIQKGVEKIESLNVDRVIIETYVKIKK